MMIYAAKAFLGICGAAFLWYGAVGVADPASSVGHMSVSIDNAHARTELRATYGGLLVGIGLFLVCAAFASSQVIWGLIAIICILLPTALVRALGMWVDDTQAAIQWQFLLMETGAVCVAALLAGAIR